MPQELKVDLVVDMRGKFCQLPTIIDNVKKLPLGGVLKVLTSDPGCLLEIPSWARVAGNEVLKIDREGTEITFYIKRAV